MVFTEILTHFQNVKNEGGQYRADCPACDDSKQHLYIKEADGKILFDCKKGCNFSDIVVEQDLNPPTAFPKSLKNKPGLSFVSTSTPTPRGKLLHAKQFTTRAAALKQQHGNALQVADLARV